MSSPLVFPLPIILGSSSKWRRAVLEEVGLPVAAVMSPDIDEKAIRHDDPREMTLAIARAKAAALLPRITRPSLLICSDQVVLCNGRVREKPRDAAEARQYLQSYSDGAYAECVNGVVVTNTKTGKQVTGVDCARQYFNQLPPHVIDSLIAQGDVMWCAGGFCIERMDGYLARREGEEESIRGMPRALTLRLLREACDE